CNCGPHGFCALGYEQGVGYVENCTCDYGYSVLNGKCEPCNCDPPGVKNIGAKCKLWSLDQHTCYCPDGFISDQDDICEDIDECKNVTACGSNTVCVNLPGSYRCDCKVGYEPLAPDADISSYGCKDIDECFNSSICVFSTTECVNSPGSFDCKCKKGHYPASTTLHDPRYNSCHEEGSKWRSITIFLGVFLGIEIIGTIYFFYRLKSRR
ncbi:hypothetical protein CEXT_188041, partial [Caerostris extrusa]